MSLGEIWRRLVFLFRGRRTSEDLEDEMRLHIAQRAEQFHREGMNLDDAEFAASRQFGNRTMLKEVSREQWGWNCMAALGRDARQAARAVRKNPWFSAVAILSLAVSLGANTAVFSFMRAIVLKRLPVPAAERLVIIQQKNEAFHMVNCCFGFRFFRELQKQDADFEDVLAVAPLPVNLTDRDQTERLPAEIVSGNYFQMLGVRPAAGRLIDERDDATEGSGRVCVISYRLWQERFGGVDVIGRRVLLNSEAFQIVGVSERGFSGAALHEPQELQIPSSMIAAIEGNGGRDSFGWARIIARLKPGITPTQAAARLNVVGRQIQAVTGPQMAPHDDFLLLDGSQGLGSKKEQFGRPVILLLGLVGVVLFIACANLTALLLVRSVERTREAGVRLALGASRPSLVRHFLAESLLLAVLGGIAGWGLARVLTDILLRLLGSGSEGLIEHVRPDMTVFAFSAGVTLAAGLLFGLLPAWRAAHSDPLRAIRGAVSPGAGNSLTSRLLIAGQLGVSLALLFGAGLFVQTLRNLRSIDVGFSRENISLIHVDLGGTIYADKSSSRFFEELLRRARELPDTRAASLADISVLSGSMASISLNVPGYVAASRLMSVAYFTRISSGYFRTLGIPLLGGRDFTEDDRGSADGVAIVNRHFAQEFFGGDALGKTFSYGGGRKVRVVGVAGTALFRSLREDPQSVMYLPVHSLTSELYLQVRTTSGPAMAAERLRALVREMDSRVPIRGVTTMEMQIDEALSRERLLAFLSILMGGLAVTLAAIGLYGVLSFSVARRTREIGIRMAIGAGQWTILKHFLGESTWIVGTGIALGIPLALGCGTLAASLLYKLKPQDLGTVVAATALLSLVAFCAALIPAWRAARLDPTAALRYE